MHQMLEEFSKNYDCYNIERIANLEKNIEYMREQIAAKDMLIKCLVDSQASVLKEMINLNNGYHER